MVFVNIIIPNRISAVQEILFWTSMKKVHELPNDVFSEIAGVYDDCFIEIEKSDKFNNTPYELFLANSTSVLANYGDITGFRPNPPKDTIVLLGIDHIADNCPYGSDWGVSIGHWYQGSAYDDAFYNFASVGCINDWFKINKKIELEREGIYRSSWKIISIIASHELGHCLMSKHNDAHTEFPYGVMCIPNADWRSYHHEGNIKFLRSGIPKFDKGF